MSDKKKIAQENKILEIVGGSQLYGTATPTSDVDYVGVFLPDENSVYGFEKVDQVDLSIVSKREDGRNDEDAIDSVLYELRNFLRLAMANNPNILEIPFANDEAIIFENEFGKLIREKRHLFPYQGAYDRFIGYAVSQKKKMVIKRDHYFGIKEAHDFFGNAIQTDENKKRLLVELKDSGYEFLEYKPSPNPKGQDVMKIGDVSFQLHERWHKIFKKLDERMAKITNRSGLLEKYGYDTKFASHLIRLLLEGNRLLQDGELIFPLPEAELLLDIKVGKWAMIAVLEYAEELENEMRDLKEYTILPKKPRYDEIQELSKEILKQHLGVYNTLNIRESYTLKEPNEKS